MNNGLDKIRIIETGKIDSVIYFQSLLEQAYTKGLLGDSDIERLQYACLNLLAYKTERYNAGDSSSILVEKAQDIMTSNLFTISLWLKTYPNPDDAVTALQDETINELYQKGRKRIDTMLSATKAIHSKLLLQLVDSPNVFYRSTIEGSILDFFKLYCPDFSAQEIHITADYPIYNPIPKLAGIEFINAYVKAAYFENLFCSYFSADDIHHLLCGYIEDYQEHLINIYEPVLLAALGCTIAGANVYRLNISKGGATYLYDLLANTPKSEIFSLIKDTATELTSLLDCPHELIQYIYISLPMIVSEIEIASQKRTLNQIFVLPNFPEDKPKIIISFGNKIEDEQYRKVVNKIMQCDVTQDKIAIIKKYIRSLADLEDVLLDTDLSMEEIRSILHELSFSEIVALLSRHPLLPDIDILELREQEKLLRSCLQDIISVLPKEKQEMIIKASEAIEEG